MALSSGLIRAKIILLAKIIMLTFVFEVNSLPFLEFNLVHSTEMLSNSFASYQNLFRKWPHQLSIPYFNWKSIRIFAL